MNQLEKRGEGNDDKTPTGPRNQHLVGAHKSMCYDSKRKCYWPSDFKFTMFTFTIIFLPASVCFACPIWGSDPDEIEIEVKVCLTVIEAFFLLMSLYNLFKCAFTEPGIIPSLSMENSGIPPQNVKQPDSKRDYYVEYKSR